MEQLAPCRHRRATTLGTINHTLLTLNAIRDRGLTVERVVMVGDRDPTTSKLLPLTDGLRCLNYPGWNLFTKDALQFHPL